MKKHSLLLAGLLAASALTLTSCGDEGISSCPVGYEGKNCDTEMREKFVGSWTADDTRTSNGDQFAYTGTITKGSSVNLVNIGSSFRDGFFDRGFSAIVEGNTITIPNGTEPDNDGYQVAGSGTYANNQISWNYYIIDTDSANIEIVHTGIWTK